MDVRAARMDKLSFVLSACLQLGVVAAVVIYSCRQMKRFGKLTLTTVICSLCAVALVLVTLFICSGAYLERQLTRDQIEDAGVIATITMACAALMAGCAAVVCLLRKSAGWRLVFILQTPLCLYLGLITMYVAMGKPFSASAPDAMR
jgi:hypothetical protein